MRPGYLAEHVRSGEPAHVRAQEAGQLRQPLRVRLDELLLDQLRHVHLPRALPRCSARSPGQPVLQRVEGCVAAAAIFEQRGRALALGQALGAGQEPCRLGGVCGASRVGELEVADELARGLCVEARLFAETESVWQTVLEAFALRERGVRLRRAGCAAAWRQRLRSRRRRSSGAGPRR